MLIEYATNALGTLQRTKNRGHTHKSDTALISTPDALMQRLPGGGAEGLDSPLH